MERNSKKAWLYLLPALVLLAAFLVYPLIDVLVYSVEECFNFASQTYQGIGLYNYSYVLHDPYFLQAVENTFVLVIITVPISTILALLIATALSSIRKLRELYQTVYFLPYVTNTLAVGLVFMVLFQRTEYTDGLVNLVLGLIIYRVGEDSISSLIVGGPYVQPLISAAIGLIPNCASSVIVTDTYINGFMTFGSCVAGLCANAGLGFVVLLKNTKKIKRNIALIVAVYAISVVAGIIINGIELLL